MTMNVQERIQQQLGALLLANIQLGAENETLRAQNEALGEQIRILAPKPVTSTPHPDKTLFVGDDDGSTPV